MHLLLGIFSLAALGWAQSGGLVGSWKRTVDGNAFRLELRAGGAGTLNGLPIGWTLNGNQLTLLTGDGGRRTTAVEVTATSLTMIPPGGAQRIVFEREGAAAAPIAPPAAAAGGCKALVGQWNASNGQVHIRADGTANVNGMDYRHSCDGSTLTLVGADGTWRFPYTLSNGVLTVNMNGNMVALRPAAAAAAPPVTASSAAAQGCKALIGRWRASTGQVHIREDGTANIGGMDYRHSCDESTITLVGPDGTFKFPFTLKDGVLTVNMNGNMMTLRVSAPGATLSPADLAGKWCYVGRVDAPGGMRLSDACFTFRPDGSYEYAAGASNSNPYGSSATQEWDNGTFTVTEDSLTLHSRIRGTMNYTLERQNHPKNNDPLIVLNGRTYATYYQRPPW